VSTFSPGGMIGVMIFAMPPQRATGSSATEGWQPVSNSTLP
jgi:hypothetical protein